METHENSSIGRTDGMLSKKNPTIKGTSFLLYLHDIIYLLAAIIILLLVFFRIVVVSGSSMKGTLVDGDYLLLVSNVFYHNPGQGDIVVISKDSFDNGAPIVKRVIATEGQYVDIDFSRGIVYVGDSLENLKPLDEPYISTPTTNQEGVQFPLQVKEKCVFVLGDNREGSKDSRDPVIGQIDKREILGKVIFLLLPGTDRGNQNPDYTRIGVVS